MISFHPIASAWCNWSFGIHSRGIAQVLSDFEETEDTLCLRSITANFRNKWLVRRFLLMVRRVRLSCVGSRSQIEEGLREPLAQDLRSLQRSHP